MRQALLTLTLLMTVTAPALAQDGDEYQRDRHFRDRARIDLGLIVASFDSKASLDGSGTSGTTIDLEEDGALDKDVNDFFFRGHYRFKPKHRIEASYYALRREGKKQIERTIVWGDDTFDVNTLVKSDSKSSLARIGYAWSFVRRDKLEVALHGDLAYIESGITLEGIPQGGATAHRESGSAGFPYPTVGLSLERSMGRRAVFDARADVLTGVSVGDVKASILAGEIGARVYVTRRFGLGAHWLLWELDAEKNGATRDFETDWGWNGLTGTLSFTW